MDVAITATIVMVVALVIILLMGAQRSLMKMSGIRH